MQSNLPSPAEQWLAGLTDTELAFVQVMKSRQMPDEQKMLVQNEADRRLLSETDVKALVRKTRNKKSNTGCHRCNSVRKTDTGACEVCGLRKRESRWDWFWEMVDSIGHAVGH